MTTVNIHEAKTNLSKLLRRVERGEEVIPDTGLPLLPVSTAHIVQVAALPHHHRDPFDRLLIAQAITERLPVITADAAFADYDVEVVW